MAVAALSFNSLDLSGDQSQRLGGRNGSARNGSARGGNLADGSTQSRVRTRTMGLRLGPFGLTYTDRDLQLHPDEVGDLVEEARSTAKTASFLSQSDIQRMSRNLDQSGDATSASQSSAPRRGAAAYAMMASGRNLAPRRSLLGVV